MNRHSTPGDAKLEVTRPAAGPGRDDEPVWLLVGLLLGAVAAVLLAWMLVRFWPFTVDDAYITLRYAANLAAGLGPVYNAEPPRAEGFTSALWVLVLAVPHLLGADAVWTAKALGVLCTIAALALAWILTARFSDFLGRRARHLPAAVTLFWLAAYHPTAVHAVSGMETALAALLLTLLVYLATLPPPERLPWPVPLLGLLLGLDRPEANPVVALVQVTVLLALPRARRRRFAFAVAGLYALPGAAYFAWRGFYFGHLFPIPFYVKVAAPALLAGSGTVLSFLRAFLVPAGFALAGCLLRPSREVRLGLGVAVAWLAICLFPANIMDYEARFCAPLAPLLFALAGYGLAVWLSLARPLLAGTSALRTGVRLAGVMALLACASWAALSGPHAAVAFDRRSYGQSLENVHVRLGKLLERYPRASLEHPILAIGDAGAVPYYSGWRVLDTFGLNEPVIGIEGNRDPAYVLAQHPALVVLVSRRQREYETHETVPWEKLLYESVLAAGMTRIGVMSFSARCHLWIMGDPQSEVSRYVAGELRKLMQQQSGSRGGASGRVAKRRIGEDARTAPGSPEAPDSTPAAPSIARPLRRESPFAQPREGA